MRTPLILNRALVCALLLAFAGCTPKAGSSITTENSTSPLPENAAVLVIEGKEAAPDGCRPLGKIKADAGGAECHYSTVIANAKVEARRMGGNVVKITRYWEPGVTNPCYVVKADVFYAANGDQLVAADQARRDSLHHARFGDHPDYAILYCYRPSGPGALIGFNLHLGDSVICRMKNYSRYAIKIYKEGPTKLWASTESKSTQPLTVRFGEGYYLKCVLTMGAIVGEPSLRLIARGPGQLGYEGIK